MRRTLALGRLNRPTRRPSNPVRAIADIRVTTPTEAVVAFEHVSLAFDENVVLRDVSFSLFPGQMKYLIGASGSGKTVVLKLILGLLKPDSGAIRIRGERIERMSEEQLMRVRDDIGMLFQENALFDSLTVAENVGYKLYESTDLPVDQVRRRVEEVLGFIGLAEYVDRLPAELSGGQRRRVAIARAMAARPHLLLFDEPTSGLDPITAKSVDAEIIKLRDLERVTCLAATHQLQDAFYVATHHARRHDGRVTVVATDDGEGADAVEAGFIMLKDGGIYFEGSVADLRVSDDPHIKAFLAAWVPPLVPPPGGFR